MRQRQADILMERLLGAAGHLVLNIRRMGVALVRARSPGERHSSQGCQLRRVSPRWERAAKWELRVSELE